MLYFSEGIKEQMSYVLFEWFLNQTVSATLDLDATLARGLELLPILYLCYWTLVLLWELTVAVVDKDI
jgi:hypothetical protein